MITVKLLGGLGNQMFQRAYGLALESRGYEVGYDKSSLIEGTHREYSLGAFHDYILPSKGEGPEFHETPFSQDMLNPPNPSIAVGYWQSEKYFQDIPFRVQRVFKFREQLSLKAFLIQREIHQERSAFIHVRRKDYVGLQNFHGLPSLEYYKKAVRLIEEKHGPTNFLIFSDDTEWCKQNFTTGRIVEGLTKYEDLQLMSLCNHAVIANSSFSWWGAWLGDWQSGRTVVAPKRWFVTNTMDYSNVVPERWIKL